MDDIDRINALLSDIGRRHEISQLRLAADGTVCLRLNSHIELNLEYVSGSKKLFAYYSVMTLPHDNAARLRLYEAMLDLNCLQLGSGHGVLAIDRIGGRALCQAGIDVDKLDLDVLDRMLRDLVMQKEEIVRKLDDALGITSNEMPSPALPVVHRRSLLSRA